MEDILFSCPAHAARYQCALLSGKNGYLFGGLSSGQSCTLCTHIDFNGDESAPPLFQSGGASQSHPVHFRG